MRASIHLTVSLLLYKICLITSSEYVLWYDRVASNKDGMKEALPIGNGRIAGLVYGDPARERINVNDISLWTGNTDDLGNYQTLGNLTIVLDGHGSNSKYRRALDIGDAISSVEYQHNQVNYKREYFASHVEDVLVTHLSADKPKAYSGHIELNDAHGQIAHSSPDNIITAAGHLNNGLKYMWKVKVLHSGGSVNIQGSTLTFKDCDSVTLILGAGTDYDTDSTKNFRKGTPEERVDPKIANALKKKYEELRDEHIKDFHSLFNRVEIDLGQSSAQQKSWTTDHRKVQASTQFDPDLEELFFQFGRYLLISSSRGFLPANLQGIWNDVNTPPWAADYHVNINVQMNYWPAEVTNLAECHMPLFNLINGQLPVWRNITRRSNELNINGKHSSKGVACARSHNIYGGMSMAGNMDQDKVNSAWYGQHFWWHYEFGLDNNYLKNIAYPYLKEVAEFWDEQLKALNGKLVVPHSWSPEHGPLEDGVSYCQEIVWDLLNNYVKAADILGVDHDFRNKMAEKRDKLLWPGVGSFGQLLEWMTEKGGEATDHHRHTSHLFAVFPGHQITPDNKPELAKAAKVSLIHRGEDPNSDVNEWSFAWRTALYARLRDGETAHHLIQVLLQDRNTCKNMFGTLGVMQIDGNFGVTGAMVEMLLQSHQGDIEVLPALPKVWSNGHIRGLRARGGQEVSVEWSSGKLKSVVISGVAAEVRVKYGNTVKTVKLGNKQQIKLDGNLNIQ